MNDKMLRRRCRDENFVFDHYHYDTANVDSPRHSPAPANIPPDPSAMPASSSLTSSGPLHPISSEGADGVGGGEGGGAEAALFHGKGAGGGGGGTEGEAKMAVAGEEGKAEDSDNDDDDDDDEEEEEEEVNLQIEALAAQMRGIQDELRRTCVFSVSLSLSLSLCL